VRAQSLGGLKAPTDPVGMVILRLARKAVQRDRAKEIASAPKAEKLALLNKLAAAYAAEHDETLRARAMKIAALEEGNPVPPAVLTKPAKKKAAAEETSPYRGSAGAKNCALTQPVKRPFCTFTQSAFRPVTLKRVPFFGAVARTLPLVEGADRMFTPGRCEKRISSVRAGTLVSDLGIVGKAAQATF
jgi:hypothetical protein